MKQLFVRNGKIALLDDEDFLKVKDISWHTDRDGYFVHEQTHGPNILLHRMILGLDVFQKDKRQVDHINGNSADNRKKNLRICSQAQNVCNRAKAAKNHGYKGVRVGKTFRAYITVNKKQIHLGVYKNAEDAARAYNKAAIFHFGQYARINEEVV